MLLGIRNTGGSAVHLLQLSPGAPSATVLFGPLSDGRPAATHLLPSARAAPTLWHLFIDFSLPIRCIDVFPPAASEQLRPQMRRHQPATQPTARALHRVSCSASGTYVKRNSEGRSCALASRSALGPTAAEQHQRRQACDLRARAGERRSCRFGGAC